MKEAIKMGCLPWKMIGKVKIPLKVLASIGLWPKEAVLTRGKVGRDLIMLQMLFMLGKDRDSQPSLFTLKMDRSDLENIH